jgi:hypothetical protein
LIARELVIAALDEPQPATRASPTKPAATSGRSSAISVAAAVLLWGEGHAPLWRYFLRLPKKKADESIAAPKGHGPRTAAYFHLHNSCFWGPTERGHDRLDRPRGAST